MLVNFFRQVAVRDDALLKMLRADSSFAVSHERWCFTLPDLHAFLVANIPGFSGMEFLHFRRSLYSSPINGVIRELGAEISVASNTGKADRSTYALRWIEANTGPQT
mgnify:CR=1 FL=1